MHPAKSVIFFTTASGAGYGMLVWLALLAILGEQPADTVFGLVTFGAAFALIIAGLLSSTFHLGHPERAFRALSQWRSSWLSREGLAAVATFVPTGLFALVWVFFNRNEHLAGLIGLAGAVLAVVTVYCTSMIYGSLKTIPAWHTRWTRVAYLMFAMMTGVVLVWAISGFFHSSSVRLSGVAGLVLLAAGLVVKILYWRAIDGATPVSTAESATGLGMLGKVSLIEAPHSEDNYLLKEMGFQIARKHSAKLRAIALVLGFAVPFVLIFAALFVVPQAHNVLAIAAALAGTIGIITERWLFFAEAKHVVTLYYGQKAI